MHKGNRFLHNHPMMEKTLGVNNRHVIVDIDDWDEARKQVFNLNKHFVSQRSELVNNFSEWYGSLSEHERDEFSTVGALEHYVSKIIK